eukprot:4829844-Heterocapsa_arctica.AAC.1
MPEGRGVCEATSSHTTYTETSLRQFCRRHRLNRHPFRPLRTSVPCTRTVKLAPAFDVKQL